MRVNADSLLIRAAATSTSGTLNDLTTDLIMANNNNMICRGLCACTEMLWMCVLYVSFGSKVRPRTFGCVAMGSALLFIVRSRLLVYSAGSGVNRVQVVLSGFNKRLFCFVQAKTLCRYGCMYFLAALVLVCVDVIVMSSA